MNGYGYSSVAVVGLGNIGSQVVPLLTSLPGLARVRLIDFDRYQPANLGFQRIAPCDVERAKARAQARVLRGIRPDLAVTTHACRFEQVPLGLLRDSVILGCVDSRAARQAINRAALALGIPWIDAALARDGNVRARAYLPGHGSCLECSWGPRDYELLEQRLPCLANDPAPAVTAAPLELGAIVAGLQVSLCRRLTADAAAAVSLADRQWFVDVGSGRGWTGRYAVNPTCRLDHASWDITTLGTASVDMPLAEALAQAGPHTAGNSIEVPGMTFVRRLRCTKCEYVRRVHCRLSGRIGNSLCDACGEPLLAGALDLKQQLGEQNTPAAVLREPLARRGVVAGDILALNTADGTRHFQLA